MDQETFSRIRGWLGRYFYVVLILLFGIILMLLPTPQNSKVEPVPPDMTEKTVPLQEQLAEILSKMDGAGKVAVLLTIAAGEKTHYQSDQVSSGTDTIIVTDSGRNQQGLVYQVDPPIYQGAIILCQGAERPAVKLAITQAVSNATGLGFDKITILKMK